MTEPPVTEIGFYHLQRSPLERALPKLLEKVLEVIKDEKLKKALLEKAARGELTEEELKKVFSNKKSKKMERGIAFPCCISVNQVCGHYSPMSDESSAL